MGKTKKVVAQLKKQARNARWKLTYEDVCSEEPPEPNLRFFTRAVVNGQPFPIGGGNNAKEAKRNAAKNALEGLREKENPKPVTKTAAKVPQKTATKVLGVLNKNVLKDRVDMKAGQSTRQDPHDAPQCSSFVVGDKERPAVPGKSTKDAKEEAAETSSGNDDVAEARPPTAMDTRDAKSKSVPMTDFINSSSPTEDEEQDPVVKPKTRLETTDPSCKSENQEVNTGNCPNDQTSTKSEMSRFSPGFDCIEKIGQGSYGQVFKARDKLAKKYRAIKIVRCGETEEALKEVKTLSDLDHPNIVRYLLSWLEDSGYSPDESGSSTRNRYLYILTELCVKSLRVWIDENNEKKSLPDPKRREEALTMFQQTVRGVEYIHSKTLIHRDLKPANIMIGQDGQVKIVDFGIVTLDNDPENLRERSMGKGTPSYMAPEQERQKTYDRKVDIFPLGLIYFELLWKMSTRCERAKGWTDLREQKFPKEFQHNFHQEYLIIKPMLCEKPEQRPEASQIHADLKKISDSFDIEAIECRGNRTV
ncbi:eukaryotic translation initiation factor 2-alpha kinase 3-like isoform X3 [Gymnodraco acuticeps]|uniref:non-specific serine/threonine protein kinase n=1 Tax=Gymnodraco acuticeps TaxID=8218 RepID=A0A6P8V8H3_GYMAC|nr:eukaryotic translation initiation factor 2-alpha kinase 3-like isoform X3 [Gymnodraco acuticeps]